MSAVIPVEVGLRKSYKKWSDTLLTHTHIYEQYDTGNGQAEIFVDAQADQGPIYATFYGNCPIPQGCNKLDKVVYSAWATTLGTDTFAQLAFVDRASTPTTVRDTVRRQTRFSESFREWSPTSGTIVPYDTVQSSGEPAHLVVMMTAQIGPTQDIHMGNPIFYFRRGGGYQA